MKIECTRELAATLLPLRPADGHKGTFGHVVVFAGSRRYPGAMRLTCEAASRSGVGLVTAGIPQSLADVAAITLLECMALPLPDTPDGALGLEAVEPALAFVADKESVVLGPGLATAQETGFFVRELVSAIATPLVLDADALNLLTKELSALSRREPGTTIITPHPGEMARLTGRSTADIQANREGVARDFAEAHQVIVVLKGSETIVARPDGTLALNTTGNHGMGTGGTGDVLAGLLGGLLAQGLEPWDAACLGTWLHGRAGDHAARKFTARAMIARDVIACLSEAFADLESPE